MKKKIILACLIASSALGFKYKDDLQAMGLRFVAPGIADKSKVVNPEEGEIIYESNNEGSTFWGRIANNWIPLGGSAAIIPSGTIIPFAGATAPNGYIVADGRALSRTEYVDLFNAIGTAYGDGTKNSDGTTSIYPTGEGFNIPDLRGRFLRGVDGAAGRDINAGRTAAQVGGNTGNAVGSVQADEVGSHTHTLQGCSTCSASGSNNVKMTDGSVPGASYAKINSNSTNKETVPKNIYVNYIIKM